MQARRAFWQRSGVGSIADTRRGVIRASNIACLRCPDRLHLTCDTPAGTDHFRWFTKAAGQTDFVFATDTADGEVLLMGLPAGQTVQVRTTVVSTAGESLPSAALPAAVG